MNLICPKCNGALKRVEYEGLSNFSCPAGHGEWVNRDDLGEIVRRRQVEIPREYFEEFEKNSEPKPIETELLESDTKCPACGALCKKVNYAYSSGILIDHCPRGCGVWLDKGELEKIQAFCQFWDKRANEVLSEKGIDLLKFAEKSEKTDSHGFMGNLITRIYDKFFG